MGLLDSLFDAGSYGGQGGNLLDLLRQTQMQQQYQPSGGFAPLPTTANQPSPLDNAQWPAGPNGAPAQQYPGQSGNVMVGDYQMPQIGQMPPTDVSAASRQPQPQAMAPQAAPQDAGLGFGDRLMAGFQGFANAGGLLPALANGVSGLVTGQRTDSAGVQQQSQRAIYEAVLQQPGMTKQKAFIIATNPKAFEAYSAQLFDNNKYAFQTLPDGTIVRQDPRTGEVAPAYQSTPKQSFSFQTLPDGTVVRQSSTDGSVTPAYQAKPKGDWGVVGEQDGTKVYGWIDKNTREVTPVSTDPNKPDTITGPDGKQIVVPKGVDRKTFVNEVSRAGAKAAAGEKTEVQAKNEKFGNQMELAQRTMETLDKEGTSYLSRATEGSGWLPGSATFGRGLQSEDYQKYVQSRNSFITALLRDESGAAIGSQEFDRREKEMFPQPGDGPKVIEQKRELRKIAVDGMKKAAGPGYKSPEFDQSSSSSTGGNKTKSGVSWGVVQ